MALFFRQNFKICNLNNFVALSTNNTINHYHSNLVLSENRRKKLKTVQHRCFSVDSARTAYMNLFKNITESDTVGVVKDALISVHDITGLSWAGTILCTTLGLRLLITLPLGVYQVRHRHTPRT